jgi:hypothetical protein
MVTASVFRMLFAVLLACAPALAAADIYIWTDERGSTVISNERPDAGGAVRDFKVVLKEGRRTAPKDTRDSIRESTPTEQQLLERMDRLEREVRERQHRADDELAPAKTYSSGFYSVPPQPQPAVVYESDYFPPYYYSPPSYIVIGATPIVGRPFGFRHRHFARGHARAHGGRAPTRDSFAPPLPRSFVQSNRWSSTRR